MNARARDRWSPSGGIPRPRPKGDEATDNSDGQIDVDGLQEHLGYVLRRLQVAVFKNFIGTFASIDLRPAQYSVLLVVHANPGRSQAAIGRALNIERARLARLLHELEGRGWLERRPANGDGRSHSLYLTNEGKKALSRIKELGARHETQVARFVGAERRRVLLELLQEFGSASGIN